MSGGRIDNSRASEFYNRFEKFDLAILILINFVIDILLFLGYCGDQFDNLKGIVANVNLAESIICAIYYVYILCIYALFWKHRKVDDDSEKFENKSSKIYFHVQGIFSIILFITTLIFICYAALESSTDGGGAFETGYNIWICCSYVYIKLSLFITIINHIYIRPSKTKSKGAEEGW